MQTHIDHLVIAARTLDEGVQWCEATLGVTPGPGGAHPLFGTHNRLLKIATPFYPLAYLEIIAIDPEATRQTGAPVRRWFDLDDAALQAAIGQAPRLVHVVASTTDIQSARTTWHAQGIDRGPAMAASRQSPKGLLQWQITVREDGQRLFQGALPTLIQWGGADDAEPLRLHPRNHLPRSRVSLQSITATHPSADKLLAAYAAIGLTGISAQPGPASLAATLRTPKGEVTLSSGGI